MCVFCDLEPTHDNGYRTKSRKAMIDHIQKHRDRGDVVAQGATELLKKHIEEEGDEVGK